MAKLGLRIQLVSAFVAGAALLVACGESSEPDGGGGAGSSSGGSSSGSGGTTGNSGGTTGNSGGTTGNSGGSTSSGKFDQICKDATACGRNALIDDFADGDTTISKVNGTEGYWSSWVDPKALGADITSVESAIAGGKATIKAEGLTGSDGASFSAGLNNVQQVNCGFNASRFEGIEIHASSAVTEDQVVRVRVVVPEVVPIAEGGVCKASDKCWGTHQFRVTIKKDQTTPIRIAWEDFVQPDWATQVPLTPERITTVEFANATNSDGFHIVVDQIGFYGETEGVGEGGAGNGDSCD